MLSWLRKKSTAEIETASVGIAVGPRHATVIACDGEVAGRPTVLAWESIPYQGPADLRSGLARFVDSNGLEGQDCRCTLSPDDYSLRLVERPANVPDEELADATRWLIRDLIEFDVERAELAILTIPIDGSRARTPHMFVVAARHERVTDLAHTIDGAGLRLLGFEIVETSMLALDARMSKIVGGGAVLRLEEKTSVLTLSHAERLYLARNLHVDLDVIDTAANRALTEEDPAGPGIIETLDALLLDIQRSFDYYESEYGRAPASRLTLLPGPIDLTPLVPALTEALRPVQVEPYDLAQYFDFPDRPAAEIQPSLSVAAGTIVALTNLIGDRLLPASFRKRDGGFGLLSVARVAAAIIVLLGVYYGISRFQLDQKSEVLLDLETERDRISDEIEAFRDRVASEASPLDPEAEIAVLTAQRDARMSMLRDMLQRAAKSDAAFSNLLSGLARQDLEGIWLERIELSAGGDAITLEGRTLDAENLPSYLRGLGSEAGFASRRFRTFEIHRANTSAPGLAFRIATLSDAAESEGARP